jgi:hypothetical protein
VTNFEVDEYNYAVIRSGEWYVFGESRVVALGHAEVKAYDKARVRAYDHSLLSRYDDASYVRIVRLARIGAKQ